jgi:hypothetical protein
MLRTVLAKPLYAEYIKHLKFDADGFRGNTGSWFRPSQLHPSDPGLVDLIVRALEEFDLPHWITWVGAIERNEVDATMAILLLHCPHLSSLTLGLDFVRENEHLPQLLAQVFNSPTMDIFNHLRTVRIGAWRTQAEVIATKHVRRLPRFVDWRLYFAFLKCSSLQNISMNLLEEVCKEGFRHVELSRQLTSLTCMRLLESSIAPSTLAKLLTCTPALTHLEYDYHVYYGNYLDSDELDVAFNAVKDTLDVLSFTCHVYSGECAMPEELEDPFVTGRYTIADFSKLSTLHVSPCILLGWETEDAPLLATVLPRTLQHICFHIEFNLFDVFQWKAPAVLVYLTESCAGFRSGGRSPSLKSLSFVNTGRWFRDDARTTLEELCQQEGMLCYLISTPTTSCSLDDANINIDWEAERTIQFD